MRTIKTLLIIVIASLAMVSCKKDKDKRSRTELITAAPWTMVKFEERENNGTWEDTFPGIEACSKDDKWIFKTNMSVDLTEGPNACSGNSPNEVLETTTWAFQDGETKLMLENDVFTIEQLDGSTLVISITESFGGVTYSTKVTMSH
jgi:hypothetical protein